MKSEKYTYIKDNKSYSVGNKIKDKIIYENLGNKNVFIKNKNNKIILKIKTNKKFKFLRIYFKILTLDNIWFGKFPDSEDLILLKVIEENMHYDVIIFQNEWKHRFMFLDLITSNPNTYL